MAITKFYYIELKMVGRWTLMHTTPRLADAYQWMKDNPADRYPYRVIQVTRKIVFNGER